MYKLPPGKEDDFRLRQLRRWAPVLFDEHRAIETRVSRHGRQVSASAVMDELGPLVSGQFNTMGLALSGGGIRSAAFCLGALQALQVTQAFDAVDYLSTVSGGGYAGSAITSRLIKGKETPFVGPQQPGNPGQSDLSDMPDVGHLRDYSNYLIPMGVRSAVEDLVIVARGLAANVLYVLPVLLLLAAMTLLVRVVVPNYGTIDLALHVGEVVGLWVPCAVIASAVLTILALPGIANARPAPDADDAKKPEARDLWHRTGRAAAITGVLWLLAGLAGFFSWLYVRYWPLSQPFSLTAIALVLAFVLLAILAVRRKTRAGKAIELDEPDEMAMGKLKRACIVVLGLALFFFVCELQPVILDAIARNASPGGGWTSNLFTKFITLLTPVAGALSLFSSQIARVLKTGGDDGAIAFAKRIMAKLAMWTVGLALPLFLWAGYVVLVLWGTPGVGESYWLYAMFWNWLGSSCAVLPCDEQYEVTLWIVATYSIVSLLMFAAWLGLKENSNSLHGLYRDRLAAAFLKDEAADFDVTKLKLSAMRSDRAPYLLINAALNIEGDSDANMRGRNADFFCFGRLYSGSPSAGYRRSKAWEKDNKTLTLASAMAISGAAFSSNMGSETIKPMVATLTLLNLRLGYWLRNSTHPLKWSDRLFFLKEMFGLLESEGPWLYLTDGGHIDNTGIYQLLLRRCATIIAIDAEADPEMVFPSFVALQRHARIDLGVRINLRWDRIAAATLSARDPACKPAAGPHCAIGDITYSNGGKGKLIYVKASLTGDENVYIRDYARRYPAFPHETTGDQFFSEEQFEVYRALGFHSIYGLYKQSPEQPDDAEVSRDRVEINGTDLESAPDEVLRPWNY